MHPLIHHSSKIAQRPALGEARSGGWFVPTSCWLGMALILLPGCGGGEEGTNAFDEISRLPSREELVEIDLGKFVVPVPLVLDNSTEKIEPDNLIQLTFTLVAVVVPKHLASVEKLRDRHAGRIRDEVMRVCRNTSRDDVLESEWTTLKSHLLDATQPLLGGTVVRRIVIPHKVVDPL